jgi:hypothetical protein
LGIEIGIRTWFALMIAMRADAMTGGYWDCHDISSVLRLSNLYGENRIVGRPLALDPAKRATISIQ